MPPNITHLGVGGLALSNEVQPMLYEITFPDGRKELRCKIGLAEQAAITTALQFRERLVVTITPEPSIGNQATQSET